MTAELSGLEGLEFGAAQNRLPDSDFIAQAYRKILGREADAAGFARSVQRMRRGVHRHDMLGALAGSAEAVARLGHDRSVQLVNALERRPHQQLATLLRRAVMEHMPRAFSGAGTGQVQAQFMPAPGLLDVHMSDTARARTCAAPTWPTQRDTAVLTIATRNYLPQVRVLMASVARHHPECTAVLLLVGGGCTASDARTLGLGERAVVIDASQLDVPNFDDMTLRYDTVELCTALKPWVLQHLLNTCGFNAAIYLDPDIELQTSMDDVTASLSQGAAVVVTPHTLAPLRPAGLPDDHAILMSGVFNLGFIAMRRCAETLDFLRWWGQQLRTRCLVAFQKNLFTDQRWCDLLPCFIQALHVLRHPGYNVAYWNLDQRPLQQDRSGQWHAAGRLMVFFHFSGFDPMAPERCSRHQTRLDASTLTPALPLLQQYADSLLAQGWPAKDAVNPYELLPSGPRIPLLLRQLYQQLHPDPAAGERATLLQALLADAFTPDSHTGLPRLLRFLHQSRSDLQSAFDLDDAEGAADFTQWVRCCGLQPLGLEGIAVPA